MLVSFNGSIRDENEFSVNLDDRAFQYGDGLFETLLVTDGKAPLLAYNFKRLIKGMSALHMEVPGIFTEDFLLDQIQLLIGKTKLEGKIRARLQVWRKGMGLYLPHDKHINYLIRVVPATLQVAIKENVGFSDRVNLAYTPLSRFKTTNALPYIVASIEKREKGLDELIILDNLGHISEGTSSNIFWIKDKSYYTPTIETGCVEGTMRNYLIDLLQSKKKPIFEVKAGKDELLKASSIFMTNATGIFPIRKITDTQYDVQSTAIPQLEL